MKYILFLFLLLPFIGISQKKTHIIPVTKIDSGHGLKRFKHIDTKLMKQVIKAYKKGEGFGIKTDGMDLWLMEDNIPNIKFSSGQRLSDTLRTYMVYEKGILVGGLSIGKRISGGLVHNGKRIYFSNKKDDDIIYYAEDETDTRQFNCDEFDIPKIDLPKLSIQGASLGIVPKAVGFHEECRFELTTVLGGKDQALSYMTGLVTTHKAMYGREGINIYTRTLIIWDTQDPYTGTNQGALLTSFANIVTTKGHSGDLAHLYGRTGGGGVAYVNGLVSLQYFGSGIKSGMQCGYTGGVGGAVSGDINTYNWATHGSGHEKGHQLGCNHTHNCVWPSLPGCNMCRIDAWGQKAGYEKTDVCAVPIDSLPTDLNKLSWMGYPHLFGLKPIRYGELPTQRTKDRIIEFGAFLQDSGYGGVPPIPCSDSSDTKTYSCGSGYDGVIRKRRTYSCATKTWSGYVTTDSTCFKKCDTIKEIVFIPCRPNQTGYKKGQVDIICGIRGDTVITENTCQDTIPVSCIYKLQGNDTTYYRISDSLVASTTLKSVNGQYVPYYIQSILTCKTCCQCTNHVYNWERIRNGVSTKITWTTGNRIYYKNYGTITYLVGDTITCTVTSPTHTKTKNCVNAVPVSIIIK